MRCTRPLDAFRAPSGAIVFSRSKSVLAGASALKLPCSRCTACRLEKSRQWAVRCVHEASLYDSNCFLTLTYDDGHVPEWGSLDKRALCLFFKRLRREIEPEKVRYYAVGEYGSESRRPHYHACLFGYDFPDKEVFRSRGEFPVWRSRLLERLWPFGLSELGQVSFESASYLARYIMKKVTGDLALSHYDRLDHGTGEVKMLEPEFAHMSRRPGIGHDWIGKYMGEVYPADSVVMRGHLGKPPRYYDSALCVVSPDLAAEVKRKRRSERDSSDDDRLDVLEKCVDAKVNLFKGAL